MADTKDPYADWTPPKGCVVLQPAVFGRNGRYRKFEWGRGKYMPHQSWRERARRMGVETIINNPNWHGVVEKEAK